MIFFHRSICSNLLFWSINQIYRTISTRKGCTVSLHIGFVNTLCSCFSFLPFTGFFLPHSIFLAFFLSLFFCPIGQCSNFFFFCEFNLFTAVVAIAADPTNATIAAATASAAAVYDDDDDDCSDLSRRSVSMP